MQTELDTLKDIKNILERSGRFISLSGFSGISAGACALLGAFFGYDAIKKYYLSQDYTYIPPTVLRNQLILIASITLVAAVGLAFLFSYLKSKKQNIAIWNNATKNLLWFTLLPMAVGGILILKLITINAYVYVGAISLLFYGLALITGSKYTLGHVRYLGYACIVLGIFNLWFPLHSITFWALGFGVCHIIYGLLMWWFEERKQASS